MNTTHRQGVLAAAFACFLLWSAPACRSEPLKTLDDVHGAIQQIVSDPTRATAVMALTDELTRIVDDSRSEEQRFQDEVRKLNVNYDTTRAQFSEAFAAHDAKLEALRGRLIDNRKQLIAATTAEEWESIAKIRARAFAISTDAEHPDE